MIKAMQSLSEQDILLRIQNSETFEAVIDTGGFALKIDRYVPMVCTAIHDGHTLPEALRPKMLLSATERTYEEDPHTGEIISSFPITLIALDSRYAYDLNRVPIDCTYDTAWGKQVWKNALNRVEQQQLREYHASYYRILKGILNQLVQHFSGCIVYDLHSYNHIRVGTQAPLFNIGTHTIAGDFYQPLLDHLSQSLEAISLPGTTNRIAFDEVFQGKGYQAAFIKKHFTTIPCIALEIKKAFMDELSGQAYTPIIEALRNGITRALNLNSAFFNQTYLQDIHSIKEER